MQKKSTANGKVLRVSRSLLPSPQTVQDPSSVATAADNLLQELASSVTRGFTGSSGRPELMRRPDGKLHPSMDVKHRCFAQYVPCIDALPSSGQHLSSGETMGGGGGLSGLFCDVFLHYAVLLPA